MEKESLLDKISSKYLIKHISSYIKDTNFIYKLFINSKYFQSKINLSLIDYKEKYFEKRIYYKKYLINLRKDYFNENKDLLNNKLQKDLLKYKLDEKTFKKIATNYFINYYKNIKKDNIYKYLLEIDIDSPLFESLSKIENFEKMFTIIISTENIKSFGKEYLTNLNILKNYYSIRLILSYIKDIIYIKDLNINFNNIKNLTININEVTYEVLDYYNYYEYFKILFSLGNFQNNLVYLNLEGRLENKFETKLLENINNLKSLEYLFLSHCKFESAFILKLENLKEVEFIRCTNLYFENNIFLKLKKLFMHECMIYDFSENYPLIKLKCPLLEKCKLIHSDFEYYKNNLFYGLLTYDKIIDFSSITKLKEYEGNPEYFLLIENNNPLEKVYLNDNIFLFKKNEKNEKKVLMKICSIKAIKEIQFTIMNLTIEDISNIADENPSVKKINIFFSSTDFSVYLDKIQKKFPNLTDFIFTNNYSSIKCYKPQIQIVENLNSKIVNIKLNLIVNNDVNKFYCNSFAKLEFIKIKIYSEIHNLQNLLPIFNDKCTVIFESLKVFHFIRSEDNIDLDILNNLRNNINKMPNLEQFNFICKCDYDITKEFYMQFIKEILSLKYIKIIKISFYGKMGKFVNEEDYIYNKDELIKLFSDININKFYETKIMKYEIKIKYF